MSSAATSDESPADHMPDQLADAFLAARLFLIAPQALGGLCLRGGGPARDLVADQVRRAVAAETPVRRMPPHIDEERLLGGIDMAASLSAGRAIRQPGLLEEVQKGLLFAPMAERVSEAVAGRLAQAMDGARGEAGFGLLLLDDGIEADERPPQSLMERVAFHCDLAQVKRLEEVPTPDKKALALGAVAPCDDEALKTLAGIAAALGIDSVRAMLFAYTAARAHAALERRKAVKQEDLVVAARLVLGPRATRLPPEPAPEDQSQPPEPQESDSDQGENESQALDQLPEDLVLEAVLASLPKDVLEQIAAGRLSRGGKGGGAGQKVRSKLRGKPLSARPGDPRGGARLALIDTLRAAVPWQPLRARELGEDSESRILVRKDDLRIRRFEERRAVVTVFCVDASGSAAMARLAEAKGAAELLLAQAYVKRSEVALIAFRGEQAELLLPQTRSLTRARRALAQLPGGGGTPLASGLALAGKVGEDIARRGQTPFLVFLTDGSANIAADGTPGRAKAREDAQSAARRIAGGGFDALVIDIAPRPRPDAKELAAEMRAQYLPLPMADAAALERAVSAATPEAITA